MKPSRFVLGVALCALMLVGAVGLAGCGSKDVAAKVNGQVIKVSDLNTQLDQLKKQYPQMFTGTDAEGRLLDFKQRLLENLINQALIEQAAKSKGINVSDADVQKQIDQLKSGFKDSSQFDQALKSAGMTVDQLKTQIRNQLVTQKLVETLAANQKVSDADIQAYYAKNKSQFIQKAAKRASHVLFKPEDKATATKVLKEIQAGTITLAAAARKYSVDTATASKGGDLGWPTTAFVPEFQAALDKLNKGQMSGLVQSPFGWHIILVTDVRPATQQPLSEVKSQIQQIIIQQRRSDAYQQFLNNLRKNAKIEYIETDLKPSANGSTATSSTATTTTP
ncbi:MAG TPA: SurA N-terminal domain-containing protein [Coriobacteriia bacterium]